MVEYSVNIKKIIFLQFEKNDLEIISPLWNKNPESYMKELLEENFEYIISQ